MGFKQTLQKLAKRALGFEEVYGMDFNTYVNMRGRNLSPSDHDLIREYKGTAYACANVNTQGVLKGQYRLYQKASTTTQKFWYPTKTPSYLQSEYAIKQRKVRLADTERLVEITNHPFLTLLNKPNENMDEGSIWELTQLFQEIVGRAYWYVPDNALGVPGGIFLLLPQHVETIESKSGVITKYKYGSDDYDPREIIPFLLPSLCNPFSDGLSPLATIYEQASLENSYIAAEAAMLANECRPSIIVSPKDDMGRPEAERYERELANKMKRGAASNLIVTPAGVDVNPVSYNPRDLARLEIHDKTQEAICIQYGVPLDMLKGGSGSQYNVHATIMLQHVEQAVTPRLRRNCATLNHYLLSRFDDSGKLFLCFDDPSPRNREMELAEDTALLTAGAIVPNEVRIKRGYEPKPWGDMPAGMYSQNATSGTDTPQSSSDTTTNVETDGGTPSEPAPAVTPETQAQSELLGKVGGITGCLAILDSLAAGSITKETAIRLIVMFFSVTEEEATALVDKSGEQKTPAPKPPMPPQDSPVPQAPEGDATPPKKSKAHRADHLNERAVKHLQGVVKSFFHKQRKAVMGRLEKNLDTIKTKGLPDEFVNLDDWDHDLYDDCLPLVEIFFRENYEKQQRELVQRTGISNEVFNVTNPKLKETIEKQVLQFAKSTNETTTLALNDALEKLRDEISNGLVERGDDIRELSNRVSSIFDQAEDYRCERIARTEANKAHNEAAKAAAMDSGVCNALEWLTSSDPCPLCEDKNGERIEFDGGELPPLHPNCECTTINIIDINDHEADDEEDN